MKQNWSTRRVSDLQKEHVTPHVTVTSLSSDSGSSPRELCTVLGKSFRQNLSPRSDRLVLVIIPVWKQPFWGKIIRQLSAWGESLSWNSCPIQHEINQTNQSPKDQGLMQNCLFKLRVPFFQNCPEYLKQILQNKIVLWNEVYSWWCGRRISLKASQYRQSILRQESNAWKFFRSATSWHNRRDRKSSLDSYKNRPSSHSERKIRVFYIVTARHNIQNIDK